MTRAGLAAGAALLAALLSGCVQPSYEHHLGPPPRGAAASGAVEIEALGPPPRPESAPVSDNSVLARVGDREIRGDELSREFFRSFRREAFAALNQLVVRSVVEREVARLQIAVPESFDPTERARVTADLQGQALRAYGKGATPERFVELEYKQKFDDYVSARVAAAREKWTIARIVRYHAMLTERLELQLITVGDERLAREIAQKLDQGAEFAPLALQHSTHQSAEQGGRLPPLPLDALHPRVAERVAALKPGERTGVLQVGDDAGRAQYEIVRLIERHPGREASWSAVAGEIDEGLKKTPLSSDEYIAWQYRLFKLYNVWFDDSL